MAGQEAAFPHSKVAESFLLVFGAPSHGAIQGSLLSADLHELVLLYRAAMKKAVPHYSRWAERRSTVVYGK